ncbi:TM2 domain-containing protein [Nocardia stercoris]|uniref:TM2 domain-containing protein n=1 Tax=Nocardia stercoris TaxID=2483361 RepID=A0A3M2KW64_9NOCA|nr:TM2 domain-containing protein [Nocardia stercoris]RMI29827.1 TM2 domain-containing protein [Nocardia stercoris]
MTDPYQQQPYGQQPQPYGQPQYGAPGTGPGQPYGAPQDAFGQQPYGQPMGAPGQFAPGYDPSAPYGRNQFGEPYSDKTKLAAGLLQIFLGGFGVGRFYLGYPGIAVAQIAVTWLTCGLGGLWPLIDGIMMLTGSVRDANGLPLQES